MHSNAEKATPANSPLGKGERQNNQGSVGRDNVPRVVLTLWEFRGTIRR
ncbi:hypothetical protein Pan216_17870 [Planctomycetes bacterium Pan216]|uniref:Uncharacterized protein n=1 Tax=Kolteria novifilia TaxID=2527975 RepID=A0A518B1S5_9BACT|nr:hypothetical protein Pan216_17870 [Planctomycetes bacterium Pan216]